MGEWETRVGGCESSVGSHGGLVSLSDILRVVAGRQDKQRTAASR